MGNLLHRLSNIANLRGDDIAIVDLNGTISYRQLVNRTWRLAEILNSGKCRRIALAADNSADWIVADLASWLAGSTLIPVPPYFSPTQVQHLLETATIDTVIAPHCKNDVWFTDSGIETISCDVIGLGIFKRSVPLVIAPEHDPSFRKITFTSGSTGAPKGVILSERALDLAVQRLAGLFGDFRIASHLCTAPLATLLENVAGVYVPLTLGATVVVPPLAHLGLYGSSRIDADQLVRTINNSQAESLILQPQVLRELTAATSRGAGWRPEHLKFVAVGGAKIDEADLLAANAVGIPAFQGYGLSECASVIALNRPGESRPNSVGKPLPGIDVRIAEDGEIIVSGQSMSGYLGDATRSELPIRTGDIGHLDDDGFLYVTGRKKDMFITSFGRNVSPEWPESALLHQPEIAQACVFGEAMPYNTAVIVPADSGGSMAIASAIARANLHLPDYARVTDWVAASGPFTVANGQLTSTGKPRRDAIARQYLLDGDTAHHNQPAAAGWTASLVQT